MNIELMGSNVTIMKQSLHFPALLIYRGYAAPARIEADVYDLEVDGAIPAGLDESYYRLSADPQYPPLHGRDIFINGDGMVHRVDMRNGHSDRKTRYVRTPKFLAERAARRALFGAYRNPFTDDPAVAGLDGNTANTTAFWHHGRLYALKEAARPVCLDPETLETRGSWDFGGRLTAKTFTASRRGRNHRMRSAGASTGPAAPISLRCAVRSIRSARCP